MGRERTHSNGKTIGTGQNVTSPFAILSVTSISDSWGEGKGTIAVGREAPALEENQYAYFQGY